MSKNFVFLLLAVAVESGIAGHKRAHTHVWVQARHGSLQVESELAQGSIRIRLPR